MKNGNVIRGVKAAILDLDGTLFDSTHLWAQIDIDFLKKRGLEPTDEYRRALGALGNREAAHFTIQYYKLTDTPEELMREWAGMARYEYEHNIKLFDGAAEYLRDMHARGITLVAVTSLARELALAGLKSNGIYDLFKAVVTADESNLSKTSPDIYIHAAEVAGALPDECVAFDDVAKALASARIAGMNTVAVRGDGVHDCGEGAADYTVWNIADAPLLIAD